MIDLMKATTSMTALISKYNNFNVPSKKLYIDNKEIGSYDVGVENIQVALSMDSASSVSFSVYNVYDIKSRQFQEKAKSTFRLGAILKLELGYGSKTTLIFQGFIGDITYELNDYPCITVNAFDMRRLMMEGKSRKINYKENSYSGVFSQVMKRYNKICTSKSIDTTEELKDQLISQNTSDFDFVREILCKNAGREFYVFAGKAYFKKIKENQTPILTLEWGKDLLSFSRRAQYQYTKVKVVGYDDDKKIAVEAEATAKATDSQKSLSEAQRTEIQPDANNKNEAMKIANYLVEQEKTKARNGSGSCIGLPEIVPGRYIKISKCDNIINGIYYIKSVKHSFGNSGFTTDFEVGGW
ncbi:MAG: contractile injection system protein, VgrG/Pvc8 family [Lachnospiraceae bacterium]